MIENNNSNNTNNNAPLLSIDTLQPSQVKETIAPFENPQLKEDASATSSSFLTRIVLTLPYRSEMTKNVLRAVYSYLIQAGEKGNNTL